MRGIKIKIDVTKIDRAALFKGAKGTYLDAVMWPTPQACQGPNNGTNRGKDHGGERPRTTPQNVPDLVGWATPAARDFKSESATDEFNEKRWGHSRGKPLSAEATLGIPSTSCPAPTGKRGALNPAHSRWLMGFPAVWGCCGAMAMQSCRKSPRRSSKQL